MCLKDAGCLLCVLPIGRLLLTVLHLPGYVPLSHRWCVHRECKLIITCTEAKYYQEGEATQIDSIYFFCKHRDFMIIRPPGCFTLLPLPIKVDNQEMNITFIGKKKKKRGGGNLIFPFVSSKHSFALQGIHKGKY